MPLRFSRQLPLYSLILALSGVGAAFQAQRTPQRVSSEAPSSAGGGYADPKLCAQCHPTIAATYKKTGMGRSFRKIQGENDLGAVPPAKPFFHQASSTWFNMLFHDGAWYQRRWQIGFDGRETNVDEKRVDFALGSGNHSWTPLHLTEKNIVQELPLGWYSEKGGYWGMNPGYDRPDYAGSVRPIYYECMFCHNGYPRIPEGTRRDPAQATYVQPLPEGIDCQRCHGPGQDHVNKASHGAAVPVVRAAIVNPARLNADREIEVCLQCHLETSSEKLPHAIVRFGRAPFSYVPGQPLSDFMMAFDREPGKNINFEVAQAGYRFRESQCFLKSAGNLRCTTCHNPHDVRHDAETTTHYNQVCSTCHQTISQMPSHAQGANCVSCHMPKRRTDDAVHIVMTDHFISRRPPAGDLLADKPEKVDPSYQGEIVPYFPAKPASTPDNDLTIAVAQVRDKSNLKNGLPQLVSLIARDHPTQPGYYAELAEAQLAGDDTAAAIKSFSEASRLEPNSAQRLIQWGDALMQAKQWPLAETKLRRATQLAPADPRGWGRLGWALWQQDKAAEAKAALEKAVSLDNEIPEIHNDLGLVLWATGERLAAENQFRASLRIQPGSAEGRLALARVLATEGHVTEAAFHFEKSIELKPDYADARLDYARLLSDTNRGAEAEKQLRAVLSADARDARAHEQLGALLAERGDLNGAVGELEAALASLPNFWRAHYELGQVLLQRRDVTGALDHIRRAAQGNDPEARAAAQQLLQQLR